MQSIPRIYEWEGRIVGGTGDGSGAFVGFPWDLKECFGKANLVPVQVEFDGYPYRGSLANMGGGPCIGLLKEIRAKIGKQAGDSVAVRLWLDTEPRVVEPTADLGEALLSSAEARASWERLSTSHRREYVKWIEEAKKPETRASRVSKAVTLLADGKKLK